MDLDTSSDFIGLESESKSQIIGSTRKKPLKFVRPSSSLLLGENYQEVYENLRLCLKKPNTLTRLELQYCKNQLNKVNPSGQMERVLVSKIRGILSYILKKRRDFSEQIINGSVTIFETPLEKVDPNKDLNSSLNSEMNLSILSNTNFVTMTDQRDILTESDMFASQMESKRESEVFEMPPSNSLPPTESFAAKTPTKQETVKQPQYEDIFEENFDNITQELTKSNSMLSLCLDELISRLASNCNLELSDKMDTTTPEPSFDSSMRTADLNYSILREACGKFKQNLSEANFTVCRHEVKTEVKPDW